MFSWDCQILLIQFLVLVELLLIVSGIAIRHHQQIIYNLPHTTEILHYLVRKLPHLMLEDLIRKVSWSANTRYDMYRHDYSISNPAPNSNLSRLYDTNYYVINSDFRVYVCIDNGSSGTNLKEMYLKTNQHSLI